MYMHTSIHTYICAYANNVRIYIHTYAYACVNIPVHAGAADEAENKHILAISTGPDHPASYDPILADAITDFFSSDWKQKTLSDFHKHIQVCTYISSYNICSQIANYIMYNYMY